MQTLSMYNVYYVKHIGLLFGTKHKLQLMLMVMSLWTNVKYQNGQTDGARVKVRGSSKLIHHLDTTDICTRPTNIYLSVYVCQGAKTPESCVIMAEVLMRRWNISEDIQFEKCSMSWKAYQIQKMGLYYKAGFDSVRKLLQ